MMRPSVLHQDSAPADQDPPLLRNSLELQPPSCFVIRQAQSAFQRIQVTADPGSLVVMCAPVSAEIDVLEIATTGRLACEFDLILGVHACKQN
jgi:hypothetical protein